MKNNYTRTSVQRRYKKYDHLINIIFMNGVDIDSMHARNKGYVVTKGLYLVQFPTSVVKKYRKRQ